MKLPEGRLGRASIVVLLGAVAGAVLVLAGFFERMFDSNGVPLEWRTAVVWDDSQWRRGPRLGPSFATADSVEAYYQPGLHRLVFSATFPPLLAEAGWLPGSPSFSATTLSAARPFVGPGPTLLRSFDPDGPGAQLPQMVMSGTNGLAYGQPARNFAAWAPPPSASGWKGVEPAPLGPVHAMEIFDDGSGRSLFVGGRFWSVGDMPVGNIARWDGERWHPVGAGLALGTEPATRSAVTALAVHDDGAGLALYAGITYRKPDGDYACRLAVWRHGVWSILAGSDTHDTLILTQPISKLVSHDPDGTGPQVASLYALGIFATQGQTRIARWVGSHWYVQPIWGQTFISLKSLQDGAGRALFATGSRLQAQGLGPTPVMRFDGTWTAMGFSENMWVSDIGLENTTGEYRLVITRSGAGGAILSRRDAPGVWTTLGGLSLLNPWSPVRHVQGPSGPSLFAGSYRYDGASVSQYGTYAIGEITPAFDDGNGPSVFVAGENPLSTTIGRMGRVALCPTPVQAGCYANCDGSEATPVLNAADFTCFLQRFAAGDTYANCDQSTALPTLNVADFTCFLQAFAAGCP